MSTDTPVFGQIMKSLAMQRPDADDKYSILTHIWNGNKWVEINSTEFYEIWNEMARRLDLLYKERLPEGEG